ncbi:hypothetical protein [Amycolatopsis magusensis]|uniref:hypothetical protein n=1 Tax=Amycolatopsis magusensis TaxID=882444 RepID=UPI0037AF08BB
MSTPEIDPVTAESMEEDQDFGDEHTRPTVADEQHNRPKTGPEENQPTGRGGAGGMDPGA